MSEIHYNQNDTTKFVPLRTLRNGAEVLAESRGQEQGVVLCRWKKGDKYEFVTWRVYRHDDWQNASSGNYFLQYEREDQSVDERQAYKQAKLDFIDRQSAM